MSSAERTVLPISFCEIPSVSGYTGTSGRSGVTPLYGSNTGEFMETAKPSRFTFPKKRNVEPRCIRSFTYG